MKKGIKYFSLVLVMFVGVFLLTGCGSDSSKKEENDKWENVNKNEKTITCTLDSTITTGVEAELSYKINYVDDYVTTLVTKEKVISDNEQYLKLYKEQVEKIYEPYKDLKYYDYKVTIDGDTMTSDVTIDYSKIDMDKFIEIDENNGTLVEDGKIKVDDIKAVYEVLGATCK